MLAITVHMRIVFGGFPDAHHRHPGQTRSDSGALKHARSVQFAPIAFEVDAVRSWRSAHSAHSPGVSVMSAIAFGGGSGRPAQFSRLAADSGLPVDLRGRVLVDDSFRVLETGGLWAAGDAAHIDGRPELLAGCGVALIPRYLVAEELSEGKLVIAWDHPVPSNGRHFIAHAEHAAEVPKVRAFVQWIRERVAEQDQ